LELIDDLAEELALMELRHGDTPLDQLVELSSLPRAAGYLEVHGGGLGPVLLRNS
jgi:hypothetical protein